MYLICYLLLPCIIIFQMCSKPGLDFPFKVVIVMLQAFYQSIITELIANNSLKHQYSYPPVFFSSEISRQNHFFLVVILLSELGSKKYWWDDLILVLNQNTLTFGSRYSSFLQLPVFNKK